MTAELFERADHWHGFDRTADTRQPPWAAAAHDRVRPA